MFGRERTRIPDEKRPLRMAFFASSMALVLATGWALWDEGKTRRPWVEYQHQFNRLEQQMVEQALAAGEAKYQSPETQAKVRGLEAALAKAEEAIQGSEYARLKAELAALERQQADKAQQIQFIKSELDEQRYRVEHAQFVCQEQEERKALEAGKDPGAPEVRKAVEACRDATVKSAEYQALVAREKALEQLQGALDMDVFEVLARGWCFARELKKFKNPEEDPPDKIVIVHLGFFLGFVNFIHVVIAGRVVALFWIHVVFVRVKKLVCHFENI